jgi:hypothetical protein
MMGEYSVIGEFVYCIHYMERQTNNNITNGTIAIVKLNIFQSNADESKP